MSRLRKFLALPGEDQRLLIAAAAKVAWTSLGLRMLPFSYWRPQIEEGETASASTAGAASRPAERIAWAVGVAAGIVPRATCLVQALAAKSLLEREGIPSRVRIGVRGSQGSGLDAHAWLVLNGQVILGESVGCPHLPLEKPASPPQSTQKATGTC